MKTQILSSFAEGWERFCLNDKYFYDLVYTNFKICGDAPILQMCVRKFEKKTVV
jgi:hypothetical protein